MINQHPDKFVAFFADQDIGLEAIRFVMESYPDHLRIVVTTDENEIAQFSRSRGCRTCLYAEITEQNAGDLFWGIDIIFLAWWPKIVPDYILKAPRTGVVNFHPSLLPFNRGKHYNFWTIVEETPFGVTLHFADEGIDSGDILFQAKISKTWEDTGGTLYEKARREIISLFRKHYIDIVEGDYTRIRQDKNIGRTHYAKELEEACRLQLDGVYELKNLLNLLRARTFEGKPACYFRDKGKNYEVRISIREVKDGTE